MNNVEKKHNEVEQERKVLIAAAEKGSSRARQASLALGLTVKSIENGYIVETLPSGETRKIRKIERPPAKTEGLKKGMTLCRK